MNYEVLFYFFFLFLGFIYSFEITFHGFLSPFMYETMIMLKCLNGF